MGKIWNPGAKRETVGAFLDAWCTIANGRRTEIEVLFGAYECYCRKMRKKDLTLGEFNDEMDQRGFNIGTDTAWERVGLSLMQDAMLPK